jgi:predicted amidohydrolase YtcJ
MRFALLFTFTATFAFAAGPSLILHHGKVVTVDENFSIHQAIAITDGKVAAVGDDATILALKDDKTEVVDLGGKIVMPGLMDSHVHPGAALTEFDPLQPREG